MMRTQPLVKGNVQKCNEVRQINAAEGTKLISLGGCA